MLRVIGQNNNMQPDFTKLKPVAGQPNFATLKPVAAASEVASQSKPALFSDLKTLYGGSEQGIARKLQTNISEAAKNIQEGRGVTGVVKAGLRSAGDVAGTIFAPIASGINAVTGGKLNEAFSSIQQNVEQGKGIVGQAVDFVSDIPAFQEFAVKHPNAAEDFNRALNLAFAKSETGKIDPKTAIPRTIEQFSSAKDAFGSLRPTAEQIAAERQAKLTKGFEEQNTRLKTVDKAYDLNTIIRKNAEGKTETITPIDTFSKYEITPKIEKGTIDMGDYRTKNGELGKIKSLVEELDNNIDTKLENSGQKITLETLKQEAINEAKANEQFRREGSVASNVKKIETRFEDYKASYGDEIDIAELNNIRKVANKDYSPETMDTSRIVGDVARNQVYEITPSGEIKALLRQQGELLAAKKYAEKINGTKVVGGRLGNMALRTTGAIIGSTIKSAPVIGPILGGIGGEFAARALQQSQFKSAWTELRALIQRSNNK